MQISRVTASSSYCNDLSVGSCGGVQVPDEMQTCLSENFCITESAAVLQRANLMTANDGGVKHAICVIGFPRRLPAAEWLTGAQTRPMMSKAFEWDTETSQADSSALASRLRQREMLLRIVSRAECYAPKRVCNICFLHISSQHMFVVAY
jgi:hypothetical protein